MPASFLAPPASLAADASDATILRDLAYLRQTVGQSAELAAMGMHDEFAQQVKQLREDPMTAWMEVLQKAEAQLWRQIQGIILDFFRSKRSLLLSVYQVQRAGVLEYVLVPARSGLEAKFELDEVLDTYSQTVLAQRFPVVIHFITPAMVPDLQHVETVNIGE